tara:strand:+ start:174 stop:383 length:210 start_codon:yes stop_codon:yes gene_type:complete
MWIPVITILWALGDTSAWINFPMANFPFPSQESCQQYVDGVRRNITKNPSYLEGYSVCIEVPSKKGEPV